MDVNAFLIGCLWFVDIVYPLDEASRTKISLTRGRFTLLSLLTLTSCTPGTTYIFNACRNGIITKLNDSFSLFAIDYTKFPTNMVMKVIENNYRRNQSLCTILLNPFLATQCAHMVVVKLCNS